MCIKCGHAVPTSGHICDDCRVKPDAQCACCKTPFQMSRNQRRRHSEDPSATVVCSHECNRWWHITVTTSPLDWHQCRWCDGWIARPDQQFCDVHCRAQYREAVAPVGRWRNDACTACGAPIELRPYARRCDDCREWAHEEQVARARSSDNHRRSKRVQARRQRRRGAAISATRRWVAYTPDEDDTLRRRDISIVEKCYLLGRSYGSVGARITLLNQAEREGRKPRRWGGVQPNERHAQAVP
jgi:hypothetical protein